MTQRNLRTLESGTEEIEINTPENFMKSSSIMKNYDADLQFKKNGYHAKN